MKNFYCLICVSIHLLCFAPSINAQVLNGSFETWSDQSQNNGNPESWFTTNHQLTGTPVTRTTDSHGGQFAARGEVLTTASGDTVLPMLSAGKFGEGFPVTQAYTSLDGFYKFLPRANDVLVFAVIMFNGDDAIGAGGLFVENQASVYQPFSVPIEYFLAGVPDRAIILITAGDTLDSVAGNPGTVFFMDDLQLNGGITGIDMDADNAIPVAYSLEQNFPNPFNPSTTIEFSLTKSSVVTLSIYNSLGQLVDQIIDNRELSAGNYREVWQPNNLPSGVYIYQLSTRHGSVSKRMILLK